MEKMVSVIVPVYNVEKYLQRCIDSICSQTYKNLEIILVDDGSTDSSGDLCDELSKCDTRILVIHQKNGGLSNARNSGIVASKGEYILFVDSDDWIEKNMIELMLSTFSDDKVSLSICGINYYDSDYKFLHSILPQKEGCYLCIDILKDMFGDNRTPYVTACTKLYKRDLFRELMFPDGKLHEDEFTSYKYIYKSEMIAILNLPLYCTIMRNDSIMGKKYTVGRLDGVEALYQKLVFYSQNENLQDCKSKVLKEFYGTYAFGMAKIKPKDVKEKERVKAINELAYKVLSEYSDIITIKCQIAIRFPKLYMCLLSIRNKVFLKRE